jgi:nucleoside-diphosphate-sugar epimerase
LWAAANGFPIQLRSSGEDVRTFLYVQDAISGLLTVLVKGVPGDIYNVGSDVPISIRDFAKMVGRAGGVQVQLGDMVSRLNSGYLHSPNKSIVPSNDKLGLLGWRPVVSLDVGISKTLDFMKTTLSQSRTWI